MNKKKILWILLLIVVIAAVVALIAIVDSNLTNTTSSANTYKKDTNVSSTDIAITNNSTEYKKKELSDGTLYSIDGKEYKADIIIGDNYFDTTINDMYFNPDSYYNKNIQVEGMYLQNLPYTFVGRYSTSNLCAYCPVGYSYVEYQLKGTIDREFTEEEDWIKIIGRLKKGNDASSYYQDYYYLEVLSLEVMNEKGKTTVNN